MANIAELIQNCKNMARILKYRKATEHHKKCKAIVKFAEKLQKLQNCGQIAKTSQEHRDIAKMHEIL